jgi:hypothetical protein
MDYPLDAGPKQYGFDLGDARPAASYEPDREAVRRELTEILESAQAATGEMPWDARTFQYHKVVFPQMARWLPDDERERLCEAFAKALRRLELLVAV